MLLIAGQSGLVYRDGEMAAIACWESMRFWMQRRYLFLSVNFSLSKFEVNNCILDVSIKILMEAAIVGALH